jgi:serine/threonine-protein kinase
MAVRFKPLMAKLLRRAALAVGLLVVVAGSALLTMRFALALHEVEVPSLVGHATTEASALLAARGLTLRPAGRRHDPSVPQGRIAAQEPPEHSRLKANRTVRVWLSLGPQRTEVPNVVGSSVRSARLALDLARTPLTRVVEVPYHAPAGVVVMQRPQAGTAGLSNEGVALLVSRGAPGSEYVMPDLIGHPVDDVLDSLRLAGLKVADIRQRSYPGRAAGTVIGQSPRPGYRVGPFTTITLDIVKDES